MVVSCPPPTLWQGTGQEATHRNFLGPHSLIPPIKKGPKQGRTAERTADANTKQRKQKTARGPPTPRSGRKGEVEGGRLAVEEARELPEQNPTLSLAHQPYTDR